MVDVALFILYNILICPQLARELFSILTHIAVCLGRSSGFPFDTVVLIREAGTNVPGTFGFAPLLFYWLQLER